MSQISHVLSLLRGQPWAIWPAAPEVAAIRHLIDLRLAGVRLSDDEVKARLAAAAAANGPRTGAAGGAGVAVLPIYGVIIPKASLFADISGGTSIQGFQRSFRAALNDPEVGAIVLDVDSPGGMVDLVTEMAAEIRAGRDVKPVTAIANTYAASAAYWLASQASELVATPSATVGAVGVYTVFEDISGALEQAGIAPEVVSAGRYKADDLGFGPLPADARAALQERIDDMYGQFVGDIAKGRGVKASEVRAGYGEGRVLTAKQAMAAGMVDRIATFDDVIAGAMRQLSRRPAAAALADRDVRAELAAKIGITRAELEAERQRLIAAGADESELEPILAGAVGRHRTSTDDGSWDGPANEGRLPSPMTVAVGRRFYAWIADDQVEDGEMPKAAGKLGHHFVDGDGSPGAASIAGCQAAIGALNGARGGVDIPAEDRRGAYDHVAGHLRDADVEPADLNASVDQAPTFAFELELRRRRAPAVR